MSEITSDIVIVTMADLRAGNHCARGSRGWFAKYGLDFRRFALEGYPSDVLLATGDPLAERCVRLARERVNGQ